jgi:tRNA (guanine-N7-)-methyltransferase
VYENFDHENDLLVAKTGTELRMKSKWNSDHFKNDNPIKLELACGRGEYVLALGRRYPDVNFIGVDIKGARIWKGAKIALENNISNVAFLRTKIELLENFISRDEVDEIWITFPDPFLKSSKYNRRLTSPNFLKCYYNILKAGGKINLKTDSRELYDHTLEVIEEEKHHILINNPDIYSAALPHPDLDILTYYEKQHLSKGKKIKFICFTLNYDSPV